MAILINNCSGTFSSISVFGFGDGVSTSVTVDLQTAPSYTSTGQEVFDFKGNYTVDVVIVSHLVIGSNGQQDNSITVTANINKSKLTLTFSSAPIAATSPFNSPNGEFVVGVEFLYNGV